MAIIKQGARRIVYSIGGSCLLGGIFFLAVLTFCQQPGVALAVAANPERAEQATSKLDVLMSRRQAAASGTFTYAFSYDITGLDPALGQIAGGAEVQIYETLVKYQPDGSLPVPGLAQSWTVSTNGLTWTFTLRPGVKFHDGTDLTASAVVSNIERWWDPANPYHVGDFDYFAWVFGGFRDNPGCILRNVQAASPLQVQLVLSTPYSLLPTFLAQTAFSIASPAAIQASTLSTTPVGTGPYQFVAWSPITQVLLSAYPAYWGGSANIQTLVFKTFYGFSNLLQALQLNTVQAAYIPTTYFPTATLDTNLKVVWNPSCSVGYLGMNRAHPPLDNLLVRQAIAHAIDKQYLINHFYNAVAESGQVASQFLPPRIWGYDDTIVDYAYDPPLARSLLTQAGYTNGFTLTLWYLPVYRGYLPNALPMAQKMQADLWSVGISATLVTNEWGEYLERVAAGEADLFMLGWGADYLHPQSFFEPNLCQEYLMYGPKDDQLCNQTAAARTEVDFTAVLSAYQWASRRVHDTVPPLLPIGHSRSPLMLRRNVAGFVYGWGFSLFKDVFFATAWVYLPIMRRS